MLKQRNKNAIVYGDVNYTYTDLIQYSLQYSEMLRGLVPHVNKVMVFADNCPEYIFSIYAILRIDAIVVPVDVLATTKDFNYIANDCRPEIILTTSDKVKFVSESIANISDYNPKIVVLSDIDTSNVGEMPIVEMEWGMPEQTVSILYTSGTTGASKGVMLSYKNYSFNIDATINQVPLVTEDSNMLLLLPLHHVFPFLVTVLAPIYAGAVVHIAPSIAPEAVLKTLQDGKITIFAGVPRLFDALAKGIMNKIKVSKSAFVLYKLAQAINSKSFSKLIFKSVHDKFGGNIKYLGSAGAALSVETAMVFRTLGFEMLEGYGMTETAPIITFSFPGENKVGYCGTLLKGLEMKFSDQGEILVKGPNVMQGYYNRPEETAQVLKGGWLHTGDVGELDEKGRLKITGRIKEIIVTSGGKNINPVEIEHALLADTEYIDDVAVFLYEEILQAIIIPNVAKVREATDKTQEECLRQEIDKYNETALSYKRVIKFHVSSQELPKTRLGKIQRFKLPSFINVVQKKIVKEDISGKSEIYLSLKKFIDEETGMYANGDDHFEIDLALDSLGRISLLSFVNENYNLNIDEKVIMELFTLNKLSEYIEGNSTETSSNDISWKQFFEENKKPLKLPYSGLLYLITVFMVKLVGRLFYIVKSKGEKNMPKEGACIYVVNHRSALDPAFLMTVLPWKKCREIYFFAKDKHFSSPLRRFLATRHNIIVMNINSNVKTSLLQMYQVLKSGKSIIIFPEGTRSKNGNLKDFKESFAILSQEAGVPVVPIAMRGAESARYKNVRIPKYLSKIEVDVLPSMTSEDNEMPKAFAARVREEVSKKL